MTSTAVSTPIHGQAGRQDAPARWWLVATDVREAIRVFELDVPVRANVGAAHGHVSDPRAGIEFGSLVPPPAHRN
jgi:hypothetical protein